MIDEVHDPATRYYNIHDKLRICIQGGQNPIADVIDREFQNFRVQSGKSDLTIVLGEVPSDEWVAHGTAIGNDIVYDDKSGEVSIQYSSKPAYFKENFPFIIRGDIRKPNNVSIYVPVLKMRLPYWLRAGLLFLLNSFLTDDEILADHILHVLWNLCCTTGFQTMAVRWFMPQVYLTVAGLFFTVRPMWARPA